MCPDGDCSIILAALRAQHRSSCSPNCSGPTTSPVTTTKPVSKPTPKPATTATTSKPISAASAVNPVYAEKLTNFLIGVTQLGSTAGPDIGDLDVYFIDIGPDFVVAIGGDAISWIAVADDLSHIARDLTDIINIANNLLHIIGLDLDTWWTGALHLLELGLSILTPILDVIRFVAGWFDPTAPIRDRLKDLLKPTIEELEAQGKNITAAPIKYFLGLAAPWLGLSLTMVGSDIVQDHVCSIPIPAIHSFCTTGKF